MMPPGMICILGRKQREKAVCFPPHPFLPPPNPSSTFLPDVFLVSASWFIPCFKAPMGPCYLKMHSKLQKAFATLPPPPASSGSLPGRIPRIFGRRCILCLHLPPSLCLEGATVWSNTQRRCHVFWGPCLSSLRVHESPLLSLLASQNPYTQFFHYIFLEGFT